MSSPTAVVHLVRYANGTEPLDEFLTSYERHEAGIPHDLVILCKGFPNDEALSSVRRRARHHDFHEVPVPDDGVDVTAYFSVARLLPHARICFMNSFTTILTPGWLALLTRALDQPGTGIAGTTGSWGSQRSFALSLFGLPNGYAGSLTDKAALEPKEFLPVRPRRRWVSRGRAAFRLLHDIRDFPGFPAPHVRTNGFLIERELLLALMRADVQSKAGAYRVESGWSGLTRRLSETGLAATLACSDGSFVAPESWPDVDLLWQGNQGGLLVADNQTRAYESGSYSVREWLSRYAWGPRARPVPNDTAVVAGGGALSQC